MRSDLGFSDLEQKTQERFDNPFGTKWSPLSRERSFIDVSGLNNVGLAEGVSVSWSSLPVYRRLYHPVFYDESSIVSF
jgi:hypothetical protein